MATEKNDILDGFTGLDGGVHAGIPAILLNKNQLGNATNTTLRGDLPSARPPYQKITLSFPDAGTQAAFETGLFQCGSVYVADGGQGTLLAAISGRLFQIIPDNASGAQVVEVTIPGDPNTTTSLQSWIWQSEKWAVWNDGSSLPVFFDGLGSRRSLGSPTFTIVNGGPWQPPVLGQTLPLKIDQPFILPDDTVVILGGNQYTMSSGAETTLTMTCNMPAVKTDTYPQGQELVYNPQFCGVVIQIAQSNFTTGNVVLDRPYKGKVGDVIDMTSNQSGKVNSMGVTSIKGAVIGVSGADWTSLADYTNRNSYATIRGSQYGVSRVVGTLSQQLLAPALNQTFDAVLVSGFDQSLPAPVFLFASPGHPRAQICTAIAKKSDVSNTVNVTNAIGTSTTPSVVPDGSTITLAFPELPTGTVGAYGRGRTWMTLPDGVSFVASDLAGGSSGSSDNQFRDAVLKISENTYLNGGGSFRVPGNVGSIKAMVFTATLDASLGQGPLQVFAGKSVFSCDAPTDRTTWQNIVNPILTESLIGNGGVSQDATKLVNGDTIFRSKDGIRSLILARREFSTWGNTPQSREVQPTVDADDPSMLGYVSLIQFDNRVLTTASSVQSKQGVYFTKIIAMNLDPLSSLRGKAPAIYDGIWQDLNVLNLQVGEFNGVERAFAFHLNTGQNKIELREILPTTSAVNDSPVWTIESPPLMRVVKGKQIFDPCRLDDGALYVDQIKGQVRFDVFYRPDFSTQWYRWYEFVVNESDSPYQVGAGLGYPGLETDGDGAVREGNYFQVKIQVTGRCRLMGCEVYGSLLPITKRTKLLPRAT